MGSDLLKKFGNDCLKNMVLPLTNQHSLVKITVFKKLRKVSSGSIYELESEE
jgi:hypothetical protein